MKDKTQPRKRKPLTDWIWILLAAGIVGAVCHSTPVAWVVFIIGMVLYMASGVKESVDRQAAAKESEQPE